MFAPPVVEMKYPIFQNASFQSFFLISGCSFLINRLLADLYELMNFNNAISGLALNKSERM